MLAAKVTFRESSIGGLHYNTIRIHYYHHDILQALFSWFCHQWEQHEDSNLKSRTGTVLLLKPHIENTLQTGSSNQQRKSLICGFINRLYNWNFISTGKYYLYRLVRQSFILHGIQMIHLWKKFICGILISASLG